MSQIAYANQPLTHKCCPRSHYLFGSTISVCMVNETIFSQSVFLCFFPTFLYFCVFAHQISLFQICFFFLNSFNFLIYWVINQNVHTHSHTQSVACLRQHKDDQAGRRAQKPCDSQLCLKVLNIKINNNNNDRTCRRLPHSGLMEWNNIFSSRDDQSGTSSSATSPHLEVMKGWIPTHPNEEAARIFEVTSWQTRPTSVIMCQSRIVISKTDLDLAEPIACNYM